MDHVGCLSPKDFHAFCKLSFFPKQSVAIWGSFSVTPAGRIRDHLVPETAPDKKQSVLVRVLRFPLPKTLLLENFSHESSIHFILHLFLTILKTTQNIRRSSKYKKNKEEQPRIATRWASPPPASRNSPGRKQERSRSSFWNRVSCFKRGLKNHWLYREKSSNIIVS